MMRVLFRVDAGLEVGSGHLARCRVLADTLHDEAGALCTFIGRDPDGMAAAMLHNSSHTHVVLDEPATVEADAEQPPSHAAWLKRTQADDLAACRALLATDWGSFDWLIVDHYAIDARWEHAFPGRVLAIDDLADRPHAADILLDQNLRFDAWRDYSSRLRRGARLLNGPRHALLRREFQQAADGEHGTDLFVSFGGADPENHVGRVLDALEHADGVSAHVAISSRHPARQELVSQAGRLDDCHLHVDAPDIAALMRDSRLAVGAGGGMAWERCACALPTLAWPIAANQEDQLEQLATAGAICLVDESISRTPEALAEQLTALLGARSDLERMGEVARQLCDGAGAARVVKAMRAMGVKLRPATATDCRLVWEWRNHPEVRATAFDTSEIPWGGHQDWFASSLENPARRMFVGELEGEAVGFVRIDRDDDRGEVSIFLAPDRKAAGLGAAMLAKLERHVPPRWNLSTLVAGIRPENDISIRLFENAGYRKHDDHWRKSMPPVEETEQ